jgi:hypothetical protein
MSALVPFVYGHGAWLQSWQLRIPAMADTAPAVVVDVLDPKNAIFFRLMNVANARAFGDMGMPAWVQLDCATLPTAMIGFAVRADGLDRSLVDDLRRRAELPILDDDQLIPLAEYTALPTPMPGHVVGFSLFSLVPGLGLRAKAMALLAMGAVEQTGITQVDNLALKTHCRFGPLEMTKVGVEVHSKPRTTLVYRLRVPEPATLLALANGTQTRVPYAGATRTITAAELREGDRVVDVNNGIVIAS